MGFAASGDAYTKRMDNITAGVANKIKIVDDTMLYEGSVEECFFNRRNSVSVDGWWTLRGSPSPTMG